MLQKRKEGEKETEDESDKETPEKRRSQTNLVEVMELMSSSRELTSKRSAS